MCDGMQNNLINYALLFGAERAIKCANTASIRASVEDLCSTSKQKLLIIDIDTQRLFSSAVGERERTLAESVVRTYVRLPACWLAISSCGVDARDTENRRNRERGLSRVPAAAR